MLTESIRKKHFLSIISELRIILYGHDPAQEERKSVCYSYKGVRSFKARVFDELSPLVYAFQAEAKSSSTSVDFEAGIVQLDLIIFECETEEVRKEEVRQSKSGNPDLKLLLDEDAKAA
ncbi:MAG: hypothetical protein ABIH21_02420 [Patescibacteria group bacterium]